MLSSFSSKIYSVFAYRLMSVLLFCSLDRKNPGYIKANIEGLDLKVECSGIASGVQTLISYASTLRK